MSNAELSESVYALLPAAGELSAAQAALDRDHELTTAPRDFAARKVCDAFRAFESGAKAITRPTAITIRLSPTAK
jgi:hypothetical protein